MILGISSFTYGWAIAGDENHEPMPETALIDDTVNFGLRCLQIGDNLPLHELSDERLRALKTLAQKHSIRLEVGARKLTEEHLQRYIKLAASLKAPLLRFVIDGDRYEPDLQTVKSILNDALPELKKRNIVLGIENHDRFKARELASLMHSIGSPYIGICLDCANSIGAGEGIEHVATLLAPYTINLHIKDFKAERLHHKMGFKITGAELGTGLTNVARLMQLVTAHNRCTSAVLEQWVSPAENFSGTLRKEREWAESGIRYLKSLPYFTSVFDKSPNHQIKSTNHQITR